MTTTTKLMSGALVGVLALAGCGGAQKTSAKAMSDQAAKAPPPPEKVEPGKKINRKVSREASADFNAAVEYYNQASEAGWTADECNNAAGKFTAVASEHDKLVEAWFNAGVSYQSCGMTKEAESAYRNALKINGSHAGSLSNLGEIYYRGGNEKTAEEYFEKAIEADGTTAAAYINLGWIFYQKLKNANTDEARANFSAQARKQLQLALAVDNVNVVARVTMALVYIEGSETNKNQLELAKLLLDQVRNGKPVLAENATEEGKKVFEAEMRRYEQNVAYPGLWHADGLIYVKRNNVGKALETFEKVLTLDPNHVEARMNIASLVIGFRKYADAEAHYRAVLKLQPKNYDAIVGLAVSLRGQNKMDEAEQLYTKAMTLDKDRPDAYFDMGLLWMTRTNPNMYGQTPDYMKAKAAYSTARDFFNQYLAHAGEKGAKKADAQDTIKDCETGMKFMDEAQADSIQAAKEQAAAEEEARRNPPPAEPPPGDEPPPDGGGEAPPK